MSNHPPRPIVTLAAALLCAACDEGGGPLQTREAFAWEDHVPAGATVIVRDMNGDIEVVPAADDTVRVIGTVSWRRGDPMASLSLLARREGNDALICAVWGDGACTRGRYTSSYKFGRRGSDASVRFHVSVPAGVKLDLRGVNGSVTAAASAPVEAHTVNGDVTVVTAVGPVRGETVNGSVDLRMSSLIGTDSVIAKTLNGDAFVYLPDSVDATLDLAVTSGSVSSEFIAESAGDRSARRLQAILGAGTHAVRVRSINGDVAVRRLDAQGKSYRRGGP